MSVKQGAKNEKKAAKKYKGQLKPNSGALWFAKGDVEIREELLGYRGILIQNKVTTKKSYSLKIAEIQEIDDQALIDDQLPVFRIDYSGQGVIVLPEWVFEHLLEKLREDRDGN